jgi:hypothetical protein
MVKIMEEYLLKNFRNMSDEMQDFIVKMSVGLAREFPRKMAQVITFPQKHSESGKMQGQRRLGERSMQAASQTVLYSEDT